MHDIFKKGQLISGYRFEEMLDEGGYGKVWKAFDTQMQRKVAIKVIDTDSWEDAAIQRLKQEFEIADRLKHIPGVVEIYHVHPEDPYFFIIMELMEHNLAGRLQKSRVSFNQGLKWAIDLCETLQQVHQKRIIHCDIKPQNILLNQADSIKFCDFGVARITNRSTSIPGPQPAALAYKAPELDRGEKATVATDVYLLCEVFFELWGSDHYVVFKSPGNDGTREAFRRRVAHYYPHVIESCRRKLEEAIFRGLVDEADKRVSLEQLLIDLRDIQASVGVAGNIPATPTHFSQSGKPDVPILGNAPPGIDTIDVWKGPQIRGVSVVTVRIEGRETASHEVHKRDIHALAWSPDGAYVATASDDKTVCLWNVATRDLFIYRGHQQRVVALAWSPDGKSMASASSDGLVVTWSADKGKLLSTSSGYPGYIKALVWLPGGLYVVSASTDGVHVSNVATRKHFLYKGHTKLAHAVACSPDGVYIASASADKTVHVWQMETKHRVCVYDRHTAEVDAIAWSSDGKWLASGGVDKTVQVWEAHTAKSVFTYRGHAHGVYAIAWDPRGRRIASSGGERTVQVWNATRGDHIFAYTEQPGEITVLAWSPDGRRIASASAGIWRKAINAQVQVWEPPVHWNMFIYNDLSTGVNAISWSPQEQLMATGGDDGAVQLLCAPRGGKRDTYRPHTKSIHTLAWSPDGKRIATASKDGSVCVWNKEWQKKQSEYRGHRDEVCALAWSPDGRRIATAGKDGDIHIWDALNGRQNLIYMNSSEEVYTLIWSPDSKYIASAGEEGIVRIWEVPGWPSWSNKRRERLSYEGHTNEVYAITCSSDGRRIASGSKDGTVRVWYVADGRTDFVYEGHKGLANEVYAVAWSPDGRYIASASYRTVHVWNVENKRSIVTHHLHEGEIHSLVWLSDKQANACYLASVGDDKKICVWQIPT